MKRPRKIASVLMAAILVCTCLFLTACGSGSNSSSPNPDGSGDSGTALEKVKVGVLVNDATGTEALAFKAYYEDYCAANFNMEFVYSAQCDTAEQEVSAIETFKTQGCKAVLSLASNDRAAQIDACASAQMYYTIVTGQLDAVQGSDGSTVDLYEQYKDNEYYLGAIGPDADSEYNAGYEMANDLIAQGNKTFAVWGGATAYFNEMHLMRVVGFVQAMVDNSADGATFEGADGKDAVKGAIMEIMGGGSPALSAGTKIGDFEIVGYFDQWDMENFSTNVAALMDKNPDVVLTVDIGTIDLFIAYNTQNNTNIKLATFGTFCDATKSYFEGDVPSISYMQGKFASSIGANLVVVRNAVAGTTWRADDGHAMKLAQGYWGAETAEECLAYIGADTVSNPAYSKTVLEKYMVEVNSDATYEQFAEFIGQSSYDEVQALKD